jgi:hypothetical protein
VAIAELCSLVRSQSASAKHAVREVSRTGERREQTADGREQTADGRERMEEEEAYRR